MAANDFSVSGKSNECSCASARSNATREFNRTAPSSPNRWKFKRVTGIMQTGDKGEARVERKDAWPLQDRGVMDRPASGSNFIRQVVEADLASGKHKRIVTRFPP